MARSAHRQKLLIVALIMPCSIREEPKREKPSTSCRWLPKIKLTCVEDDVPVPIASNINTHRYFSIPLSAKDYRNANA
jgi:hypothetical protein